MVENTHQQKEEMLKKRSRTFVDERELCYFSFCMQDGIESISDFFHRYKRAAWDKDINSMVGLYDSDVVIFDIWHDGFYKGISVWRNVITDWLTSLGEERVNVGFEMTEIQESEAVGFASALIQYQAVSANDEVIRSMKNRISLGFVKQEGIWKVKHQHTSAPVDSHLRAILDL